MMTGRFHPALAGFLLCALSLGAGADSAYDQAVRAAGPGYVPPAVPEPTMKCETCTTRTPTPNSGRTASPPTRRAPQSYGVSPAVTVGGAILGSFLGGLLSPAEEIVGTPDPAEQARAAAAQQAAEAEARRRAAKAEERHRALIGSLKGLGNPPASPPASSAGELQLKSPATLEALRNQASAGWDTARLQPDIRLEVRYPAIPLASGSDRPQPLPLCSPKACRWPENAAVHLPPAKLKNSTRILVDGSTLATLLAAAAKRPDAPARAMALAWVELQGDKRTLGEYVLTESLRDTAGKLGKSAGELLTVWGVSAAEEALGKPVKALEYLHDVLELTQTTLDDAGKAAGWLGSMALDDVPELTPLSESAKPFLLYGAPELENLAQVGDLGARLLAIWRGQTP